MQTQGGSRDSMLVADEEDDFAPETRIIEMFFESWNWRFGFVICRAASCCWRDRPAVERPPQSAFCRGSWTSGSRSGPTKVTWSPTAAVSMVRASRTHAHSFHRFQLSPSLLFCLFFCQSLEWTAYPAAPSQHNSKTSYSEPINTTGWRL